MYDYQSTSLFFWSCWGCIHHTPQHVWQTFRIIIDRVQWFVTVKYLFKAVSSQVWMRVAYTWGLPIALLPFVSVAIMSRKWFSRRLRDVATPWCRIVLGRSVCPQGCYTVVQLRGSALGQCRPPLEVGINARYCRACKLWLGMLDLNF